MPNLSRSSKFFKFKINPSYVLGGASTLILAIVNIFGVKGLMALDLGKSIYFGEDTTFNLAIIKRISEGWIYNNSRMGYPFGSNLSDYPIPDFASLVFFKLLSYFGLDPIVILNVYFFFSFPVTFFVAMAVVRRLHFSIYISCLVSILFTLLPFHFERFGIGHLFYTWYFVIPLYTLIAADTAGLTTRKIFDTNSRNGVYKLTVASILLAFFGIYYALFGIILLTATAFFIAKRSDLRKLKPIFISIVTTLGTLFFLLLPNFIFRITNGSNLLVAARSPVESEVYGLKFVQFILPNYEHRIEYFRKIASSYASNFPLINENMMSSLGLIGSVGLLYLLFKTTQIFAGNSKQSRSIKFYVFNFWVLFMFATVGGFGAVFALAISPQIRGWNRIGIYISFFALLGLATLLKELHSRLTLPKVAISVLAMALLIGGIADTMPRTCSSCINGNARYSEIQSNFVNQIESSLPSGAAIFQYPYTQFPEVPMTNVTLRSALKK
jgi:phosphoglycerol transferase